MKLRLKPLILGIAISSVGLSFTISHASPSLTLSSSINQDIHISQFSSLPNMKNGGYKVRSTTNTDQFNLLLNRPLLVFPISEIPNIKSNAPIKKNEIFEIAAIFNDKLQQFFALVQKSAFEDTNTTTSQKNSIACRASKS